MDVSNQNFRTQLISHFKRELKKLEPGLIRGQPFAPYICPNITGIKKRVSIIFMSYGYSFRSELLIKSLDRQKGINDELIEIITLINNSELNKSKRYKHEVIQIEKTIHKSKILNKGANLAVGDIFVFTDADALFPPYFLANLIFNVQSSKLYTSVRKNLPIDFVELVISDPSLLDYLDYQGLRNILPNRWGFDWIVHTPSGFLHILPRKLFYDVGMYNTFFLQFDEYDWEFATRVFSKSGEPILVPDMWAIHMDHPRDYTGEQITSERVKL